METKKEAERKALREKIYSLNREGLSNKEISMKLGIEESIIRIILK